MDFVPSSRTSFRNNEEGVDEKDGRLTLRDKREVRRRKDGLPDLSVYFAFRSELLCN